ncbi:MAG: GNAT family N-acetyltransferase [Iphinoe sp. HA4291-MV1]|jgi:putative hemolysin|nr:GNAT family N-acetyltransferase [Iphinoe sp. HA4291-MV1]
MSLQPVQSFGFYSRQLFNLNGIPDTVLQSAVEIGRACIAEKYRNSRSLFLLWKGLANYLVFSEKQYLFGCSSLLTQELKQAACAYHYFQSAQLVHPIIHVKPHSQYECEISQDFL